MKNTFLQRKLKRMELAAGLQEDKQVRIDRLVKFHEEQIAKHQARISLLKKKKAASLRFTDVIWDGIHNLNNIICKHIRAAERKRSLGF